MTREQIIDYSNAMTEAEKAILAVIQRTAKYPYDAEKDLQLIRELATDFPEANMLEAVKDYRTYYTYDNKKVKNYRLALRNWVRIADEKRKKLRKAVPAEVVMKHQQQTSKFRLIHW
jgi:hypothetical protein